MSDTREDLDILLPDATVQVGGRNVTVRELRFAESLQATALARPIIEAVRAQVETHGEELPEAAIMAAMAEHAEAWVRLIALCTGEPEEWIRDLPAEDGLRLQVMVWERNRNFFASRLALALARGATRSRSSTSSASSSRPDTGTTRPTSPAGTPGGKSSGTGAPSSAGSDTAGRI